MNNDRPAFWELTAKTIVAHTVTYMFMGILALVFLNYAETFAQPEMASWMRQVDDPMVMAGPLFQPLRGLIFALAFYPLRQCLFGRKRGWLILWWLLVALGILSTFGPAPGSVEGMIYTLWPLLDQISAWREIVLQALLFSAILVYWVDHPEKKWMNWVLGGLFFLIILFPILGLLVGG